jgi:S-adenosylmethionine-dependent methyltransferase
MTHDERMIALNHTWNMLSKGDLWCIVETPNRLWFYDGHTSLLPFYHWLPDELAFEYSQFSPRQSFREQYREISGETMQHFLRRGRGVSFHEFELTMDRAEKLDVVSSLLIFLRKQSIFRQILWRLSIESRYESLLARIGPKVHRGFYQQYLDLIIRKG